MIVALEVPLAVTLQSRAKAELRSEALARAQEIAAQIGHRGVTNAERLAEIQDSLEQSFRGEPDARAIVVGESGTLRADSAGADLLGRDYSSGRPEIEAALSGQSDSGFRFSKTLGQTILVAAVPIRDQPTIDHPGNVYGAVRISVGTATINENVRRVMFGLIAIGLAGLLAGLIIAFALAGSFARPLSRLAAAAKQLGGGDLSARAGTTKGASEIRELADSFDEMAERLESTVRAQREFVANATHQLRTPLTGMKLRLESAIQDTESPDIRRQLEGADREVDRLAEIVERLLATSRRVEAGAPGEVDLGDAVNRAISRWRARAESQGATLSALGDGPMALSDPTDVDQILDNLVDNALKYAGGEVIVESGQSNGRAYVAVEDRGPGISPQDRGRVTERFYRGKGTKQSGSGLGLAIVRQLAERWNGTVIVDSPPEGGTRIEVHMETTDKTAAP